MSSVVVNSSVESGPLYGYLPVNVALLRHVRTAPVDIFIQVKRGYLPTLYCRAGLPTENTRMLSLSDVGVRDVYVRSEDFHGFGAGVLESVESLEHEAVPPEDRFAAMQLAVAVEVEHATRLVDCGKLVTLSRKIGCDLVSIIAGDSVLPRDLFRIARHDFNTFTHVTNVASYCVVLAARMGISDQQELKQIATGAMLHDIGKRFIPTSLLTKRGRLLPAERELIEMHPTRGYEELCDRTEMSFAQLMMVYQHHEHIDGNGYPVGVRGDDIHPWAKMLAVVDVFDAMTGSRPYRRRASAQDALRYIHLLTGMQFDSEIAQCWISAMNEA